jgi:hypothetical protein
VRAFLEADYFSMTDYRPQISDSPEAYRSLTLGERHKRVVDRASDIAPQKLRQLEDMIDKVAGSNRWINIDAAGVKERVLEGWNVRSPEAGLRLLRAAQAGDANTVRAFLEAGADANAKVDVDAWSFCKTPRDVTDLKRSSTPLQVAKGGEVVSLLISNGANVNPVAAFRVALQFQVELGDAESVKTLVEAGANIDASLWPNGATTLILAASTPGPAIVKVLLQRGAKVNAKDATGRTGWMRCPTTIE